MGSSSSKEENEKVWTISPIIFSQSVIQVGYRVLGVQPNSPAEKGGLVSFFDFIIAADGKQLTSMDSTFVNLIQVNCL